MGITSFVKRARGKIERDIRNLYKPVFVQNYRKHATHVRARALLYYKNDIFKLGYKERYTHTNNWEIGEILRILNHYGYAVDVLDRKISPKFMPENKYELFIGSAAGNSGKYYAKYAQTLTNAVRVFYAAGPEPRVSNKLIHAYYKNLQERHNLSTYPAPRRLIDNDGNVDEAMQHTDEIMGIGNAFSEGTYAKYGKPFHKIFPSSLPSLALHDTDIETRSQKKFLYFGGSGHIVKGLDLVIEVFAQTPDLELHICGPEGEAEFNEIYKPIWEQSPNIHFHGFTQVGGELFNEVTSECGFIILPSCSEGIATSVTTCMRRGLIPVVTYEAGIDVGDFGYLIDDIRPDAIRTLVQDIARISDDDLKERMIKSYKDSFKYTQAGFTQSFEIALINILTKYEKI